LYGKIRRKSRKSTKSLGHLHKKTKKAKILVRLEDFSFLILLRFDGICFQEAPFSLRAFLIYDVV